MQLLCKLEMHFVDWLISVPIALSLFPPFSLIRLARGRRMLDVYTILIHRSPSLDHTHTCCRVY